MSARSRLRAALVALLDRLDARLRKRAARLAWSSQRRHAIDDAYRASVRRDATARDWRDEELRSRIRESMK